MSTATEPNTTPAPARVRPTTMQDLEAPLYDLNAAMGVLRHVALAPDRPATKAELVSAICHVEERITWVQETVDEVELAEQNRGKDDPSSGTDHAQGSGKPDAEAETTIPGIALASMEGLIRELDGSVMLLGSVMIKAENCQINPEELEALIGLQRRLSDRIGHLWNRGWDEHAQECKALKAEIAKLRMEAIAPPR